MKKNNKKNAPNECSMIRWIATVAVGMMIGGIMSVPLVIPFFKDNQKLLSESIYGIPWMGLFNLLMFVPLFFGMVIALRWIGKTSLKDFILGEGGTLNKKEAVTLIGIHALGILLSCLISIPNISWRGVEAGTFALLLVLMILLTWIQTTLEELIFRGVFLRWACKNKIGYTKKAFFAMILSSIIFGVIHLGNVEISSMGGAELVIGVICYILPGLVLFFADLQFGSLLPGILVHWANNFLLFTLVSAEVNTGGFPTLFVDSSEVTAPVLLISTILAYLPVTVYVIWNYVKDKKRMKNVMINE